MNPPADPVEAAWLRLVGWQDLPFGDGSADYAEGPNLEVGFAGLRAVLG